jgi:hypothetical protein
MIVDLSENADSSGSYPNLPVGGRLYAKYIEVVGDPGSTPRGRGNPNARAEASERVREVERNLTKALVGAARRGIANSVGLEIMWMLEDYAVCNLPSFRLLDEARALAVMYGGETEPEVEAP